MQWEGKELLAVARWRHFNHGREVNSGLGNLGYLGSLLEHGESGGSMYTSTRV